MATVAASRKSERGRRKWIIWGVIALAVVGLCAAGVVFAQNASRAAATTAAAANWTTADVVSGPIDASVSATGNVEPLAESNLAFNATGNVTKILVSEGQEVTTGTPLAQLDTADLELSVIRADADLKQAQADYDKLVEGASKEEIAQSQAQVAQARGQLSQTSGSVTAANINAARAQRAAAKTRLARLERGEESDTTVQQAQANLEQARSQLAASKERARLDVETSANAVRNAQDEFDRIYWDNRKLEEELNRFGEKLSQEAIDRETTAKRAMDDADTRLKQSQIAYEEARQQEITTLASREADVRSAQNSSGDNLADARAQVQTAQAEVDRLTGANRTGSLEASRAGVDSAQAALDKLLANPTPSQLAIAQASVTRAEASLKQAQRSVEQATLTAPFDGTVTKINIRVGEPASAASTTGALTMADFSSYHIDVPIDELDVAQVEAGQTVRITLDAVPDKDITGKVASIAPVATRNDQGTTTYEVRVDIDPTEVRVMPGMTASVDVVTSREDNAVLVPRRAIQTEGGTSFVWVPTSDAADPASGRPASERRDVTLGMSNAEFTAVTAGLQAGDKVLVANTTSTLNPFGGG